MPGETNEVVSGKSEELIEEPSDLSIQINSSWIESSHPNQFATVSNDDINQLEKTLG